MIKIRKVPQMGLSRDTVWSAIASKHGAKYTDGPIHAPSAITFDQRENELKIEALVFTAPQGGARNTYVRFSWKAEINEDDYLNIYPKGFMDSIKSLFTKQLGSGNMKVDSQYAFCCRNESFLRNLIVDERVSQHLLSNPQTIINLGPKKKHHATPPDKVSAYMDRIGDIRTEKKMEEYLDFLRHLISLTTSTQLANQSQ